MSEMTYGIRPDEAWYPNPRRHAAERHIASGSGWDYGPGERGGGHVPERNPWRDDSTFDNPAQQGIGLLSYRGPDRRKRPR
jgi:hypothetical protein